MCASYRREMCRRGRTRSSTALRPYLWLRLLRFELPLRIAFAPAASAPTSRAMAAASLDVAALASAVEAAFLAKHKQRWARAAELFDRAARACEAGSPPDSLVSADLRLRAATALLDQARMPDVSINDASAQCASAWAMVSAASRTLAARADAGTLLPGSLRDDELAYVQAMAPIELRVQNPDERPDSRYAKLLEADAPLIGYESMLRAAHVTLGRLMKYQMALPPLQGAEADAACAFVLRALAVIPEIRHAFRLRLGAEVRLAHLMAQLCPPARPADAVRGELLDARFYDALVSLWLRPDVVEALHAHGALAAVEAGLVEADKAKGTARMAKDVEAVGGLRRCALPSCHALEATARQFKLCGGCRQVAYCSADHAKQHWKSEHKRACTRGAADGPAALRGMVFQVLSYMLLLVGLLASPGTGTCIYASVTFSLRRSLW